MVRKWPPMTLLRFSLTFHLEQHFFLYARLYILLSEMFGLFKKYKTAASPSTQFFSAPTPVSVLLLCNQ